MPPQRVEAPQKPIFLLFLSWPYPASPGLTPFRSQVARRICKTWLEVLIKGEKKPRAEKSSGMRTGLPLAWGPHTPLARAPDGRCHCGDVPGKRAAHAGQALSVAFVATLSLRHYYLQDSPAPAFFLSPRGSTNSCYFFFCRQTNTFLLFFFCPGVKKRDKDAHLSGEDS